MFTKKQESDIIRDCHVIGMTRGCCTDSPKSNRHNSNSAYSDWAMPKDRFLIKNGNQSVNKYFCEIQLNNRYLKTV